MCQKEAEVLKKKLKCLVKRLCLYELKTYVCNIKNFNVPNFIVELALNHHPCEYVLMVNFSGAFSQKTRTLDGEECLFY